MGVAAWCGGNQSRPIESSNRFVRNRTPRRVNALRAGVSYVTSAGADSILTSTSPWLSILST
jgi:hypothetical protein